MTYDPNANYCSKSPDGLFGVKFNYACYLHDRQYRNEVKLRMDRDEADVRLKENIKLAYELKGKYFLGFVVSWVYYIGVRLTGWRTWVK